MPILQFFDKSNKPQAYDFVDMSLCRLASIYISLREISENNEDDEIQAVAIKFAGAFEPLQGFLNLLVLHLKTLELSTDRSVMIRSSIDIQDDLQLMYNHVLQMNKDITLDKLKLLLGGADLHLLNSIQSDLVKILEIVLDQKKHAESLDISESSTAVINNIKQSGKHLFQLRDFFNIYLVDPLAPRSSITTRVAEPVKELTRLGADFFGSILEVSARSVGVDAKTAEATQWLKSWNDTHTPVSFSKPSLMR